MWDDGWTVVTDDRKRTAQFEHTILVTDTGAEILTTDRLSRRSSGARRGAVPDQDRLQSAPKVGFTPGANAQTGAR